MNKKVVKTISITENQAQKLVEETADRYPVEACALLLGVYHGEKAVVKKVRVADNINDSSTSFALDPSFVYQVLVEGEREGLEIVGIFHAHPAPPYPSSSDREGMKLWPVIWLIAENKPKEALKLFAFKLGEEGEVEEVMVELAA
ncbi:MAG: Mov34/MPN/PAD-1 family protein [Candidatus Hodarchaeota archaeon]